MLSSEIKTPPQARQILSTDCLKQLNLRSNWRGLVQLSGHLTVILLSGYLWSHNIFNNWWIALPMLILYGFSLASMFAVVHECTHRTAFASNRLNDIVGWWAGVLSGYNSTFYRYYHKWHHRYTRIVGKDPELEDPEPNTLKEYIIAMGGIWWWLGKIRTHYQIAVGKLDQHPYIPENARSRVVRSTRLQLGVYGVAIASLVPWHNAISTIAAQPWFIIYWLLPLAVGQPILRLILLAEHTGCSYDDNPLTNTRTTKSWLPIKFLMWNMPFHAEHHLYPSIPFHALPQAHQQLASYFKIVDDGYLKVNQNIIANFIR